MLRYISTRLLLLLPDCQIQGNPHGMNQMTGRQIVDHKQPGLRQNSTVQVIFDMLFCIVKSITI